MSGHIDIRVLEEDEVYTKVQYRIGDVYITITFANILRDRFLNPSLDTLIFAVESVDMPEERRSQIIDILQRHFEESSQEQVLEDEDIGEFAI